MGQDQSKQAAHMRQNTSPGGSRLSAVLEDMKKLQNKEKNVLLVERTNIMGSALPYFKSSDCIYHPLEVNITLEGVNEQSVDLGGPTREFFTIFFKDLLRKEVDMFEGQTQGRNLLPVNNDKATSGDLFMVLGKAIVLSLISGGPGFPYLAPCVVNYIREKEYDHELNIGLVYNTLLRQLIKRINNAESAEQLYKELENDTERFIDNCGWPRNQMITMENRLQLTQTLLRWELIGKRAAALDQLKKGLNTLQFLELTNNMPEADEMLLHTNTEHETAKYLKTCMKAQLAKLKAMDENEEQAKCFTLSCMEMLTDAESTNMFHFITGMSSLPVEDLPLEVEFNRTNKKAELPEAITCIQRLRIPLGNDSQMAFYSGFHKALSIGRYGFGGNDL